MTAVPLVPNNTILINITAVGNKGSKPTKEISTPLEVANDENLEGFVRDKNIGIFRILHQQDGDKRVVWNRISMAEIKAAKELFDKLIAQGLQAFRINPGTGQKAEKMDAFDEVAEEVLFCPVQMISGG